MIPFLKAVQFEFIKTKSISIKKKQYYKIFMTLWTIRHKIPFSCTIYLHIFPYQINSSRDVSHALFSCIFFRFPIVSFFTMHTQVSLLHGS